MVGVMTFPAEVLIDFGGGACGMSLFTDSHRAAIYRAFKEPATIWYNRRTTDYVLHKSSPYLQKILFGETILHETKIPIFAGRLSAID